MRLGEKQQIHSIKHKPLLISMSDIKTMLYTDRQAITKVTKRKKKRTDGIG